MESILKSIKRKKIPINPAVVISNKPNAKGLKIAKKLGISIEIIESKGFKGSRWQYDKKVIAVLKKHGVTPRNGLVCLAGFMRIISPEFIKKYKNRIINIHPAILPAFPGLDAQKQALEHGAVTIGFSGWAQSSRFSFGRRADYSIPMSDHCDFNELVDVVVQSEAEQVYTIHGFVDEFAEHLQKIGINAQPLLENSLDDFT